MAHVKGETQKEPLKPISEKESSKTKISFGNRALTLSMKHHIFSTTRGRREMGYADIS